MRIRWFIIVVLGLIGLIWIGQGTGVIRSSGFMTNDLRWALAGLVLVVAAVGLAVIERRRRPTV